MPSSHPRPSNYHTGREKALCTTHIRHSLRHHYTQPSSSDIYLLTFTVNNSTLDSKVTPPSTGTHTRTTPECQRKTTTTQAATVRLRLRLYLANPYLCRSRTTNNHRRLLRHSRTRLHTRSMTVLLHPTAPASTNDHTHSLRLRKE